MNLCVFDGGRCQVCGAPLINARQLCGTWKPGLGDVVASGLEAIGITKDRVSSIAGGDCGCLERQKAMNNLGYRLGLGTAPVSDDEKRPNN